MQAGSLWAYACRYCLCLHGRWPTLALHPGPCTVAVTQLAFSPDGRFLASASRDRSVALFERQQQPGSAHSSGPAASAGAGSAPFRLVGRIKAHARIVWGLHWSPDGRLLATASRDGKGESAAAMLGLEADRACWTACCSPA